jgi:hypothetical protein
MGGGVGGEKKKGAPPPPPLPSPLETYLHYTTVRSHGTSHRSGVRELKRAQC